MADQAWLGQGGRVSVGKLADDPAMDDVLTGDWEEHYTGDNMAVIRYWLNENARALWEHNKHNGEKRTLAQQAQRDAQRELSHEAKPSD